jgi:uncharacterized membrane protein
VVKKLPKALFTVIFIGFFVLFLFPEAILAKSYSVDSDKFTININKDRSIDVEEEITFNFENPTKEIDLSIPTTVSGQDYSYATKLTNFSVNEADGASVPLLSSHQEQSHFMARFATVGTADKKTFVIRFQLSRAVKKFPEGSELFWQPIGREEYVDRSNVTAIVILPKSITDTSTVFYYAHSPAKLKAQQLDPKTVMFSADKVPAGQPLEFRVVFPTHLIYGKVDVQKSLTDIEDEEKQFKEDQKSQEQKEGFFAKIKTFLPFFWLLINLGIILWWYGNIKKYSQTYQLEDLPKQVKELPSNLPPAEIEVLMKFGADPTINSFSATIFDLVDKDYIKINPDFTLSLNQKLATSSSSLKEYETLLIQLIFGNKLTTSIENIKNIPSNQQLFQKWWKNWQKEVKTEVQRLHLYDEESLSAYKKAWIITAIVAVLTFNPLILIAGKLLNHRIRRLSIRWVKEAALWQAFKRYLDSFSEYSQLPLDFDKQYRQYFIFGILFGNVENLIKRISREATISAFDATTFAQLSTLAKSLNALTAELNNLQPQRF